MRGRLARTRLIIKINLICIFIGVLVRSASSVSLVVAGPTRLPAKDIVRGKTHEQSATKIVTLLLRAAAATAFSETLATAVSCSQQLMLKGRASRLSVPAAGLSCKQALCEQQRPPTLLLPFQLESESWSGMNDVTPIHSRGMTLQGNLTILRFHDLALGEIPALPRYGAHPLIKTDPSRKAKDKYTARHGMLNKLTNTQAIRTTKACTICLSTLAWHLACQRSPQTLS